MRLRCGTLQEFWNARPCEVAAALGIGVYAPKVEQPSMPSTSSSGKFQYAQDPLELNRQRTLAAQGLAPEPEAVRDSRGVQQLTGAL